MQLPTLWQRQDIFHPTPKSAPIFNWEVGLPMIICNLVYILFKHKLAYEWTWWLLNCISFYSDCKSHRYAYSKILFKRKFYFTYISEKKNMCHFVVLKILKNLYLDSEVCTFFQVFKNASSTCYSFVNDHVNIYNHKHRCKEVLEQQNMPWEHVFLAVLELNLQRWKEAYNEI